VANLTLIHNPTFVWPNGYLLDADKDGFLSASDPDHILTESYEPNDYSLLASAGPYSLMPGETQTVCFGIVAGASLLELEQNVDTCHLIAERGIVTAPDPDRATGSQRLLPNRPNPFASSTTIRFELAKEQAIRLALYDVVGRRIRLLAEGRSSAGMHTLRWDGRDQAGRGVAAGIYFVRLRTEGRSESRRILLMR